MFCSSSGRVEEGSKAAFSVAAAASSLPDLEYSVGSGLRESLSWVSLRAWLRGEREKGRVVVVVAVMVGRKLGLAIERRRRVVGSCISVVGLSLVWSVWLLMKVGMFLVVRLGEAEMGWFRGWCGGGCTL